MFCSSCGSIIEKDFRFCEYCGMPNLDYFDDSEVNDNPEILNEGVRSAETERVQPTESTQAAAMPSQNIDDPSASLICEKCGSELEEGSMFCDRCGAPVSKKEEPKPKRQFCFKCGYELEVGSLFCDRCGAKQ